ncbi:MULTISPECIES: type VII secretion target [unclassified Shinella]|uniref:type VII secretion target n=1 Tax=unclassified Shinella TaxID=2643062 RepID=UPI00234E6637|nr:MULTISPECIES: type VII secretion target [unclassified Shinella]MCO5152872.1 type VII secretion target [Shinella sp.]MDC7260864.1 chemotaxis protein [Shinella sp. HY16]MDC7267759.1 chemotaxis protein [Shinella sp. YZ44]
MSGIANAVRVERQTAEGELVSRLEGARSRIEQRFLDGGVVLLSVLDVLNRLVASLENLSGSLGDEAAEATIGRLIATVDQLTALPGIEEQRQQRLANVAVTEKSLGTHIADMQETLRYLRTFATTAKITGAAIPDFAGFAEEILERIQFGSSEVNALGAKIGTLGAVIETASAGGGDALERFRRSVPDIAGNLSRNAADLTAQRRHLSQLAARVGAAARGVQGKVATTLSAMQIGDITRQRIEHCQSAFTFLDEYLAAGTLDAEAAGRLTALIRHLVHDQLVEIAGDFARDCKTVVGTIRSFGADIDGLMALYGDMDAADGRSADRAMRILEADIAAARAVVRDIEQAADKANVLGASTVETVQGLLKGVKTIQLVRTDIHYMALNTNLRCGKLGEEGRAINVVTAELRLFSSQLDETAERILVALQSLEGDAGKLREAGTAAGGSLDAHLDEALEHIRRAGDRMEEDMTALRACGADVSAKAGRTVADLDFKAELGDVLADCSARAGELIGHSLPDTAGLEQAMADLGSRIARTYTMVSEREVHARVFGTTLDAAAAPAAAQSDEDLFDDALF